MEKNTQLDGWGDILGGLGSENSDRNVYFKTAQKLEPTDLQNIMVYDGLANIVCSEIPGDGLRNGINIQGDENDFIKDKMSKLNYKNIFIDGWTSARGLGGSLIVLDIDDNQEPIEPVNENNINDIKELVLYDRTDVQILTENYEHDVNSDNYGKLKYYLVTYQDGTQNKIHVSRCLYLSGDYLPTELKEQNDYFDGSVIQRVYNSLTKIAPAFEYTNKLLKRFNILKFGINGLSEIVANGKKQEVKDRLQIMKQSMDIMSACMYDANGETITSETISLNGIPELLKMMMILYSSESRIPVDRMFSKLFGGIGDGGNGDESRYYDYVKREAERVIFQPINQLIRYITLIKGSGINFYNDISWNFEPLVQYSQKELVAMEKDTVANIVSLFEWQIISKEQAQKAIEKLKTIDIDFDMFENNKNEINENIKNEPDKK